MTETDTSSNRILLVSGVSGAGKSSALKLLEDIGFEAVDNMPLALIGRLIPGLEGSGKAAGNSPPLAVGVDIRTRDFEAARLLTIVDQIEATANVEVSLLFMDCDDEVLGRRYEETRRRHPLAADRPVIDGIRRELAHEVLVVDDLIVPPPVQLLGSSAVPEDAVSVLLVHFELLEELLACRFGSGHVWPG